MPSFDPYTSDSGYLRFHLVRMVVEKLPPLTTAGEVVELLDALAKWVAGGAAMPDETDEEHSKHKEAENTTIVIPTSGGYL